MHPTSERWKEITPSEFPWEQEALALRPRAAARPRAVPRLGQLRVHRRRRQHQRGRPPRPDPAGASSSSRSRAGRGWSTGDAGTWTWHHEGRPDLRRTTRSSSPTARPSGSIACCGGRRPCNKIATAVPRAAGLPARRPDVNCQLERERAPAASTCAIGDATAEAKPARPASSPRSRALQRRREHAATGSRVDAPDGQGPEPRHGAGRHPPLPEARGGSATTSSTRLLFEGPRYQDWEATARLADRASPAASASTPSPRRPAPRRARRMVAGGPARVPDPRGHPAPGHPPRARLPGARAGPALVFEHDREAIRLDHFLAEHGEPARRRRAPRRCCGRSPRRSATPTRRSSSTAP